MRRADLATALSAVNVGMAPPAIGGLPLSELDVQGWNVGYSARAK